MGSSIKKFRRRLIANELDTLRERLRADNTAVLRGELVKLDGSLSAARQEIRQEIAAVRQQITAAQQQLAEVAASVPRRLPAPADHADYSQKNPEVGLMAFLYSYLPTRIALDIGANAGDVSERLLQAGYEVYAFEPVIAAFDKLRTRLVGQSGFRPFRLALGREDSTMTLHLASDRSGGKYEDASVYSSLLPHAMLDDLVFTETTEVPVRSLTSLHQSGEIPARVGLVKIDTEGFDLEVVRGMGAHSYPVVVAEFWDANFMFGKSSSLNRLDDLATEMRSRGYHWFLVIYRVEGCLEISFFCNHARSLDKSWGNVFFFQDYELFRRAMDWCSMMLQESRFFF